MSYFKSPLRVQDLFDANAASPADGEALVYDAGTGKWIPAALGGGGQANTASNQGVGGVGLYDTKVGVDLQFRNINAASSKITVALDAGNKEVDINLGTVNLDDLADVVITTPSNGYVLTYDSGSGTWIDAAPTGGGASALDDLTDVTITTVASNNVLQYNGSAWVNLSLASAGISAVGHTHATSDITSGTMADARIAASNVTQHVASIDHDATLNFVANEHIDHTSVSISTATGLSGGGTIASTRTISLDINALTADASPVGSTDYVLSWDASASAHKKVLIDNLPSTPTAILDGDFSANGLMTRTASGTYTSRTVTGTTNEITVSNGDGVSGDPTLSLPSTIDLGGKTSLEIPNSATPTVDADGEIAVDTTVTDFSHGILKYYSGEELGVIAMPIAQFTSPTNNYVVTYDSTADEFQLKAAAGGSSPLTTNNDLYYYSSGDARLAGPSFPTQRLTVGVNNTLNWFRMNELPMVMPSSYHALSQTVSGTGAVNTITTRWGRPGRIMTLGTTATGACSLRHMDAFAPFSDGDGSSTFKVYASFIFEVKDLSDATNEYVVQIGQHGRLSSSTAQTDGAFFLYDRATYGNANLRCITRSAATATTTDSGVAVTADTQILLDICWSTVSGTATNVTFYINGTLVATHTTNLTTSSIAMSYFALKSAGTTSREIFGGEVFITGGQA